MGPEAFAAVTINPETGAKLSQKVLEAYINVLKDGGMSYLPMETDPYVSGVLNMVNAEMKIIFSIETEPEADDILINETPETRQALYEDTMKFFETLYGENTDTTDASEEGTEEALPEESMEDIPYEEAVY